MSLLLAVIAGLAAASAFLVDDDLLRRKIVLAPTFTHFLGVLGIWLAGVPVVEPGRILALDAPGLLFLTVSSLVFLTASVALSHSLATQSTGHSRTLAFVFTASPRVFCSCFLFSLSMATVVCAARHFALLWVALEATTLASAPLIFHPAHSRSLEAAWKYVLTCTVGMSLALLGTMFLGVSASAAGDIPFTIDAVRAASPALNVEWLKLAFLFILVGYGTKAGLAPFHMWLPDAYAEAPTIFPMISGALVNCALLAVLRVYSVICVAGGETILFAQNLLVFFGLASIFGATIHILRQEDFKRLLGYSTVEHMGLIVLGVGLGGVGVFGALLHALNHGLAKAMLFIVAGNIAQSHSTRSVDAVRGMWGTLPGNAALWLFGLFAISGAPPFGLFVSELFIVKATFDAQRYILGGLALVFLTIIFVGMATVFVRMCFGEPETPPEDSRSVELPSNLAPAVALCAGLLLLGYYIPGPILRVIDSAAQILQGGG
ncbi:MAG: hypothetical protein IT290_06535 [Deltaproteobacteria bacterium]|nr:hypothetical protein [Deltaproteobacteria bacterium]